MQKAFLKTYQNFQGVDFSTSPAQVDDAHSPLCENIVADFAGYPEKRVGWRKQCQVMAPVNGMWNAVFASGATHRIVHGGTKLYTCDDDTPVELYTSMNNAKSTGFAHGGKLYILDGANYLCVYESGSSLVVSLVTAMDVHIPTTCIARVPDGVTVPVGSTAPASTPFEEINLLTPKAKNSFAGTASGTVYVLDTKGVTSIVEVKVNGVVVAPSAYTFSASNPSNYGYPTVTFTTAPGVSTLGAGVDNVLITWSKTVSGNADKITKCTIVAEYGYFNDNRFFFAGNPSAKNTDWCSGTDDPTYWPEYGYTKIGADTNPIMGYLKQGDALAIIKADNEQDAEIFLRTAEFSGNNVIFPVKQGVKGIGAISTGGFANMVTDALFLAKEGLFALVTTNTANERAARNRSYYVNARLTKETDLSSAVIVSWQGLLLIVAGTNCYVADNRQGDYRWYFWTNIPARVFLPIADALYFGTADGYVCRFNSDTVRMDRYSDGGTMTDGVITGGERIFAQWSTKLDNLRYITMRKTMLKKGSGIMIKPFTRSSINVYIKTDAREKTEIASGTMDRFSFEDIRFDRFTFNASDSPQTIPFNAKIKKFINIQFIFENDVLDEGFGILGAQIQYVIGQYVK
jgi:hypothetical protein